MKGQINSMKKRQGFTLIEVMITLIIVSILATIAIPSYQNSVRRGRRPEAKSAVNDLSHRYERCMTQFGGYDSTSGCSITVPFNSTPNGFYSVTAVVTASTYTITATAQGSQAADKCTTFVMNNLNVKTATGADSATCW